MYKQCQRRGNLEQRKWFNHPIWSKRQIFAVFKRFSVCPHIQICIKSKLIIHHTKSIVCQTNLLMTTLAMLEHIVALLIYTKRPLGLEYFHNEIVILVNVSSCLLSRTCCRRGCCGGWHPPPSARGHGVSHACWCSLLTEHTAEVTEDVSVSSSLCPLAVARALVYVRVRSIHCGLKEADSRHTRKISLSLF